MNPVTSIGLSTTSISTSARGRGVWEQLNGFVSLASRLSTPRLASQEQVGKAKPSFLDHERSIAPPEYSRWLVPPAALAIDPRWPSNYVSDRCTNLMVRPVPQKYWLPSVSEHADANLEPQTQMNAGPK